MPKARPVGQQFFVACCSLKSPHLVIENRRSIFSLQIRYTKQRNILKSKEFQFLLRRLIFLFISWDIQIQVSKSCQTNAILKKWIFFYSAFLCILIGSDSAVMDAPGIGKLLRQPLI